MVYGIGVDIIKIERFERALERWGDRLRERVFTPQELSICHNKAQPGKHLALRFAAKEAFLKALGIGMFQGVAWKEIEIINDSLGRPRMGLRGDAAKICQGKRIKEIFVSISHEAEYGVAHVLLEA
ncbi:MAG: holo-[acyl-carrier-protein] synthase [Deltaproteobacteria bacterium RBG_13_52_11]|nr:MAG: holo-[acyl-carrier-protein] synthase [Deltaproteobacteria bacterium RBG_13_52_11]